MAAGIGVRLAIRCDEGFAKPVHGLRWLPVDARAVIVLVSMQEGGAASAEPIEKGLSAQVNSE